jgi:cytochrome c-type biogenesis protein CcmF
VTFLLGLAAALLLIAFVTHDFSLAYVSGRSSTDMPLRYVVTAFYGGQAGSLLYWALVAGILSSLAFARNRARFPRLTPFAVGTVLVVEAFFLYVLVFVASPFAVNRISPAEGQGLNPLLRDPGMLIHPPTLLAGFASFVVPFAIVVSALLTGRMGNEWLQFVRRWALVSWAVLSVGIFLGGWWAYHVLGWGGYWAWDPVENVSLLPWLVATAFIHSILVQERRGMLKVWNVCLLLAAFLLSIMGTFIVRSGLITSVHAFALSDIGPYFLGFLCAMLVASIALVVWRLPLMRAEGTFESSVSRESGFLVNNLLFTGIAFATLWGTIYPLVTEAVRGTAITVGAPFYNQVNGPMLLALLILMGVGPLLGWRNTNVRALLRTLAVPLALAIALIVIVLALFGQPLAAIGFGATLFALGAIVVEFWRGARLRRKNAGESVPVAVYRLTRRDPRRYGGYVVHAGVAIIAVGIIGSWFYQSERQVILSPGESVEIAGYTLTYQGLSEDFTSDSRVVTAALAVSSGGDSRGVLDARRFFYRGYEDQPTTEVGLKTVGWDDVYVMLLEWSDSGEAHLRVFVNPLVPWIWGGGAVYLFGMFILFLPMPRPRPVTVRAPAREGPIGEPVA